MLQIKYVWCKVNSIFLLRQELCSPLRLYVFETALFAETALPEWIEILRHESSNQWNTRRGEA